MLWHNATNKNKLLKCGLPAKNAGYPQRCGYPQRFGLPAEMRVPEVMRVKTRKNPKPAPLLPATIRNPTSVPKTITFGQHVPSPNRIDLVISMNWEEPASH